MLKLFKVTLVCSFFWGGVPAAIQNWLQFQNLGLGRVIHSISDRERRRMSFLPLTRSIWWRWSLFPIIRQSA